MWALAMMLVSAGASCPKYQCNPKDSPYPLSAEICSFFDGSDYYLQTCPQGQVCPASTFTSAGSSDCQVVPAQPLQSKAGDPCFQDSDCAATGYFQSGKACNHTSGRCLGLGLGGNCRVVGNSVCNPGLYCLGGICVVQKNSGAACVGDYNCEAGFGCNYGKCQPYFSFPAGTSVSDCLNFISFFCQSGSCSKGKCMSLIANVNFLPQACESSTDCVGVSLTETTVMYEGQCMCGRNPRGWGFCQPFSGDAPGERYIEAARNLLYSNATKQCNSASRFGWSCLRYSSDPVAAEFLISQLYFGMYAEIQLNDVCVKEIYTRNYWSLAASNSLLLPLVFVLTST